MAQTERFIFRKGPTTPIRQQRIAAALSREVARQHGVDPARARPARRRRQTLVVRQRPSTGEVVLPGSVFRLADFGQLCAMLGLSPSRPRAPRGR